ncbi:MAG: DUF2812 domain-containing protein [Maledivibacter sp.]|jgi:hypothetical protein|nr:DUF2812 domain-containing protein [Maledivibacter sp.]
MSKDIIKKRQFTSVTDYKSLEVYFEEMAAKGYMLVEGKKGKFTFEKCEPKDLDFNVSLFYPHTMFDYPDEEKSMDFRELCESSGWTYCTSSQIYQIFYKDKKAVATPIHTDSSEEYKIIKNTFMKTEFISMIMMLIIIGTSLNSAIRMTYESLFSNAMLITIITPVFLILAALSIYLPKLIWFIRNNAKAKKGEDLYFASEKMVLINTIITWTLIAIFFISIIYFGSNSLSNGMVLLIASIPTIISLIIGIYFRKKLRTKKRTRNKNIILFVITLVLAMGISLGLTIFMMISTIGKSDFGNDTLPDDISVLRLSDLGVVSDELDIDVYKDSSILVPFSIEYMEDLPGKHKPNQVDYIETHYIRCRNNNISNYIFKEYVKEKQERYQRYKQEYLDVGAKDEAAEMDNQISEINIKAWNVEQGYFLDDEKSTVIIKKGDIIYVLRGDLDFSKEEIISICKEKLNI